jgi:predicted phosphoribosyltransferase
MLFQDREDSARQLAATLKNRVLHDPLVLAIPRGGVVTGAVLAQELGAELDVVLSRKLRAPGNPVLAIGAISEDEHIYLNDYGREINQLEKNVVEAESRKQLGDIMRRKKLFRAVRSPAIIRRRSVIITDDGMATGSTMIAALQGLKAQKPRELIVATPVASPDRLREVKRWCDEIICLHTTDAFRAIGQFYDDFSQVDDERAVELVRSCQHQVAESKA